jgi:hypothetical protein
MYPYNSQVLVQEHAKDLQNEATWASRARQARLARRVRRVRHVESVRVPDSYEDFLCQTAESAMREPTASGRAAGQTIR